MISCDTNVLFAAFDSDSKSHVRAAAFLREHRTSEAFCICEQVLMEFYTLIRNPAVTERPLTAAAAVAVVQVYRAHPVWRIVDFPGPTARIPDHLWRLAASPNWARRRIFDGRLALTLLHHGVNQFATCNTKDFQTLGFDRVWNPRHPQS